MHDGIFGNILWNDKYIRSSVPPFTDSSMLTKYSECYHTITIVQNKVLRKTFVQNKGNSRGKLRTYGEVIFFLRQIKFC